MPPGFPDALRSTAKRFLNEYGSELRLSRRSTRWRRGWSSVAPGGHTPGHSVVRLASGGDRLMFAGDAVFAVGFEHPEWYNGFETRPRGGGPRSGPSLRELAGDRGGAGGHSSVVPVRLPCGGRRRRLSLCAGLSGSTDRLLG